jgi:hypothetical protein
MHRFIRAAIRIAFWGAVLAAVASAADLAQPEPVPDRERPLRPGEFRGPTIQDILNACSAAGDNTSADAIDDPGAIHRPVASQPGCGLVLPEGEGRRVAAPPHGMTAVAVRSQSNRRLEVYGLLIIGLVST